MYTKLRLDYTLYLWALISSLRAISTIAELLVNSVTVCPSKRGRFRFSFREKAVVLVSVRFFCLTLFSIM